MSNQIREAVDAAVVAAWDDNQRRILYPTNRPFSDLPEPTQALWRADAVATIAAFLRALPDHFVMQSFNQPPVPGGIGNGSLHTIAAAVEAEGE